MEDEGIPLAGVETNQKVVTMDGWRDVSRAAFGDLFVEFGFLFKFGKREKS